MGLKEKIREDLIKGIKEKNDAVVPVLRMIISDIKNIEIAKKRELEEEEVIQILLKQIKQRREALLEYKKGGRDELANKEEKELEIIEKYLPKMMSREEISKAVEEVVTKQKPQGMKDFGKIMKVMTERLKGKAEGKMISEVVREILSKN